MTAKRRGPQSATDFLAELERDEVYQARKATFEAEIQARESEFRLAERSIVSDLRDVGVPVDSVWDLYKFPDSIEQAIPVLLHHLVLDYPDRVLEGIGHGLADKAARRWWPELKALYLKPQREPVRDRLAAALAECAKREHYDDLLTFVADPALGPSRIYFLRPINRIGNRIGPGEGRQVIERLAEDAVLGVEASAILKKRGRNEG